jgi:hypothetical protein
MAVRVKQWAKEEVRTVNSFFFMLGIFMQLRFVLSWSMFTGKKLQVIKLWRNGVQTLNPVELVQWIMNEVADRPQLLQRSRWAIFEHPPYSPDLAPIDFHLFSALKDHFSGHRFANDDVKIAVTRWLKSQGTEFNKAQINKPVPRLGKCLNFGRNFEI